MTDRELLEAAAKAAGIDLPNTLSNWLTYDQKFGFQWWNMDGSKTEKTFNPLNDDGDAFRLAVKLKLSITSDEPIQVDFHEGIGGEYEYGAEVWLVKKDGSTIQVEELYKDDPSAATRRAIVRAAAEMGKIPATL